MFRVLPKKKTPKNSFVRIAHGIEYEDWEGALNIKHLKFLISEKKKQFQKEELTCLRQK